MMWGWFLSIIDPEKDRGITRRPADWHLLFDRFYFGARRLTPKHSRRRLRSLPHGLNPYFFSIGDQRRSFDKKMMLDKFVFSYAKTWFGGQTAGFWELTSVWRFSAWSRIVDENVTLRGPTNNDWTSAALRKLHFWTNSKKIYWIRLALGFR